MKRFPILFMMIILFLPPAAPAANGFLNVKQYGARGDGTTDDTGAVQKAIQEASERGGGTVFFPAGRYLIKPVQLYSGVRLYLDNGCVILGSTNPRDYENQSAGFTDTGGRKFGGALINATGVNHIAIEGNGTIDGQGYERFFPYHNGATRPFIIRFEKCKNVKIKDVSLINSAAWVQHYIECEDLIIKNINVKSYSNKNNDGLDIERCERVIIEGCIIDSEDDSIVLKTQSAKPCRDIVINNCIISGLKSAIKTGTESVGRFENITISNCSIYGTRGISLLSVDGSAIENVTISNISMRDSYAVIVMRLGARMKTYSLSDSLLANHPAPPKSPGTLRNIMISNIQASNVTESNDFISGIPGHYIENVTLQNIRIQYAGGGTEAHFKREIPERIEAYPKAKMFGVLPSYGLFIRHAKNVSLKNLELYYHKKEERPAIYCDDVSGFELLESKAKAPSGAIPLLFLHNVQDAIIFNCATMGALSRRPPPAAFLQLSGSQTRAITLQSNFFSEKTSGYVVNPEVDKNEIHWLDNPVRGNGEQ